jgi:hypothetical protein
MKQKWERKKNAIFVEIILDVGVAIVFCHKCLDECDVRAKFATVNRQVTRLTVT